MESEFSLTASCHLSLLGRWLKTHSLLWSKLPENQDWLKVKVTISDPGISRDHRAQMGHAPTWGLPVSQVQLHHPPTHLLWSLLCCSPRPYPTQGQSCHLLSPQRQAEYSLCHEPGPGPHNFSLTGWPAPHGHTFLELRWP